MFSAFYEEAYKKHFEGASLVVPAIHPGMDMRAFSILGTIISHAYLVLGILPIRISFPCLAGMLLNKYHLPDEMLIRTLRDSISVHDAAVCNQALEEINK
jgi:hypothetical protein